MPASCGKSSFYITTSLILTPEKSVREYEIACDVLGRRSNFDPLEDNIVRAQMSHLRRKLETYYREEGRSDPLRLSIPKGSYLPHFAEVRHPPASDAAGSPGFAEAAQLSQRNAGATASTGPYRRLLVFFSVACVALLATTAVLVRKLAAASAPKASAPAAGNAFVQFLSHLSGPVKIVLPDTSLVAIQEKFDAPLTLQEYARPDYLQSHIDSVNDPEFRFLLRTIRNMHNTRYDEVAVGMEIQKVLDTHAIANNASFARDITIRDVSEGNTVLLGSYRSNPLAALFKDQLNYRFEEDPVTKDCYFINRHRGPGEPARYFAYTMDRSKWNGQQADMDSYVDIAWVPNLTHSGYVLLWDGSDNQAILAASRFLMHGKLPAAMYNVLKRNDVGYFEFFFHGYHVDSQDEAKFELLSVRSEQGK